MDITKWDLVILLVSLVGGAILYANFVYGKFARKGVKTISPPIPFLGNMLGIVFRTEHFTNTISRIYNSFPGEKYVGYFEFLTGIIIIRDIELLKKICIKDFDYFQDHRRFAETDDSIFTKHLSALRGQRWRNMRATLSPAFTGSKMRSMFQFVVECAEEMTEHYKKQYKETGKVEIEMKDTCTRYTNDVIASCAFGLKVNSLQDTNNEFYSMGKKFTTFNFCQLLKYIGFSLMPKVMMFLGITIFDFETTEFFKSLVQGTMKIREDKNIIREDMIHLLMEAKKGSLKHEASSPALKEDAGFATAEDIHVEKHSKQELDDDDLTAQALLFFVAGFDTISQLLCFFAHEMAANPGIQKRVQAEIDEVKAGLKGQLSYDDLQKLTYMDMVISETLRFWPPAVVTDRACAKPYTLPPAGESGKEYKVAKYDALWIPIYAIHHDPKHFPNPEKFDPERFSEENKGSIKPYSFLPFGIGPRNCIGSRFALMEAKAIIFYLLSSFDFYVTPKTEIPLVICKDTVVMKPKNGFWIGLKPRMDNSS